MEHRTSPDDGASQGASSPLPETGFCSHGSHPPRDPNVDARWSAERQIAVSQIKSITTAYKFDGQDAVKYRRWKADLEDEVRGLRYTSPWPE